MLRTFVFIFVAIAAVFFHWAIFLPGAFLYGLYYFGYELLVLGFLVDAYYSEIYNLPFYTLLSASIILLASFVRPYLSLK